MGVARTNALAMQCVFEQLGFTRVVCLLDPFRSKILHQLQEILQHADADALAIFITEPGGAHAARGAQVSASDMQSIKWRDDPETVYKEVHWREKPKLLISESCRVVHSQEHHRHQLQTARFKPAGGTE